MYELSAFSNRTQRKYTLAGDHNTLIYSIIQIWLKEGRNYLFYLITNLMKIAYNMKAMYSFILILNNSAKVQISVILRQLLL